MQIHFNPAITNMKQCPCTVHVKANVSEGVSCSDFPTSALEGDSVIELYSNSAVGRDTGLVQYAFRKWT